MYEQSLCKVSILRNGDSLCYRLPNPETIDLSISNEIMSKFNVYTSIMQSLSIKENLLLELQIIQTRHPLSISDGKNV